MSKPIPIQPIILAGGTGTRLWPLSRAAHPKQFLVLEGNRSLLQQAASRLGALGDDPAFELAAPIVLGNEAHRFLILDQLREVQCLPSAVVLEPAARNTAPAVTLAALQATIGGSDPVLVVTPADQVIGDPAAFCTALSLAVRAASDGAIVILGITPDRPETGYGYIQAGAADDEGVQPVLRFVEKPDATKAAAYLASGDYAWNAGIFVLRASTWLQALGRCRPDILAATEQAFAARAQDGPFVRPAAAQFAVVPAESVDYAVLERCAAEGIEVRMVPLSAGWSDLGAWDAVWQLAEKDSAGNAARGDVRFHDTNNTFVYATSRLVSTVGLSDVVVVETPDAVLVTDRARSQDVKEIVGGLARDERSEHALHRKVHRPWGWYDSIDMGERFQVKRIMVKPGASLSLQKHHHRAEHWIVVSGTAEVTCGERIELLAENQSTYIPLGAVHRLANPGKVPLEIIEVQSGSYLGEDDIVRLEDRYGRKGVG